MKRSDLREALNLDVILGYIEKLREKMISRGSGLQISDGERSPILELDKETSLKILEDFEKHTRKKLLELGVHNA